MTTMTPAAPRVRLEILNVAEPCHADWSAMTVVDGDRTRFCRDCRKHVYNLSAMSRTAAEQFMTDRFAQDDAPGESVCIRMFRRADGTVVTADCDGAWRRTVRRARAGWLVVATIPALLAAALRGERSTVLVHPPVVVPPVAVAGGCPPPLPAPPMMGMIRITTRPTTAPTTAPAMP